MSKIKLSYQDEQAIKEFEEITLEEALKKEMAEYEQNRRINTHAPCVPWNVYLETHKENIIEKIRKKFRFQFV